MSLIVPLSPVPFQIVSTILNSQNCTINVYQKSTGLYMDLFLNNLPVMTCVACLNNVLVIYDEYIGFLGDFFFIDMQGSLDPTFDGLGSRFFLVYAFPDELGL